MEKIVDYFRQSKLNTSLEFQILINCPFVVTHFSKASCSNRLVLRLIYVAFLSSSHLLANKEIHQGYPKDTKDLLMSHSPPIIRKCFISSSLLSVISHHVSLFSRLLGGTAEVLSGHAITLDYGSKELPIVAIVYEIQYHLSFFKNNYIKKNHEQ